MCGIFCSLGNDIPVLPNNEICQRLVSRGPDSVNTVQTKYPETTAQEQDTSTRDLHITLHSTVLSLRGSRTVTQPYQDPDGKYTLCWNGEAWSVGGEPTTGNDTEVIHKLLADALKASSSLHTDPMEPIASATVVSEALSTVAGPYAFVLFEHSRGRLFFGRDFLGRRSLLKMITEDGDLVISSVSDGKPDDGWTEVVANGVYCVDLHVRDPIVFLAFRENSGELPDSYLRRMGRFIVALAPYSHIGDGRAHNIQQSVGMQR
jgi:asparagine synthetase B (glutamine-hydrolysing)